MELPERETGNCGMRTIHFRKNDDCPREPRFRFSAKRLDEKVFLLDGIGNHHRKREQIHSPVKSRL